jgi:hypothetical protein
MVSVTVSIDEDVLGVLKAMAKLQDVTVEEVLRGMVAQSIEELRERMNDPLIGALDEFDGAGDNVASCADDIIRSGWQPG